MIEAHLAKEVPNFFLLENESCPNFLLFSHAAEWVLAWASLQLKSTVAYVHSVRDCLFGQLQESFRPLQMGCKTLECSCDES
jgi:hypothetical protein